MSDVEFQHPLPYASWETRGWWEGAGRGEVVLQRCTSCGLVQHKPRAICVKNGLPISLTIRAIIRVRPCNRPRASAFGT